MADMKLYLVSTCTKDDVAPKLEKYYAPSFEALVGYYYPTTQKAYKEHKEYMEAEGEHPKQILDWLEVYWEDEVEVDNLFSIYRADVKQDYSIVLELEWPIPEGGKQ